YNTSEAVTPGPRGSKFASCTGAHASEQREQQVEQQVEQHMALHRGLQRLAAGCCLALAVIITVSTARAQDFPNRPVKIITDSAPGSAVDVILRVIADRLTAIWGQQVLPVNQPGAGGAIAARLAASSPPDGYTLFIPALSTFVAPPGAAANLPIE